MRRGLAFGAVLLSLGCGRSFTAPAQKAGPEALVASPGWLNPAPNEVVGFEVHGGVAPYTAWTVRDGGQGCGVSSNSTDGGFLYASCERPSFQDQVIVRDAAGTQTAISVTVGAAFLPQLKDPDKEPGCQVAQITITGGLPPYHLRALPDAGAPPGCAEGAAFTVLPNGPTESPAVVKYLVPAWVDADAGGLGSGDAGDPDGYEVEVYDDVRGAEGTPPDGSVYFFHLDVLAPASQKQLISPSPVSVQPYEAKQLDHDPPSRPVSFEFAPDGNSSRGTITSTGQYVAGPNANTVDHVLVHDLSVDAGPLDVWIAVGNPVLPVGVLGGGLLLPGDLNGDGVDDFLLFDADQPNGSERADVFLGGNPPSQQSPLYVSRDINALEMLDVNGDGLADLLLVRSQLSSAGDAGPTWLCSSQYTSPACAYGGGRDVSYGSTWCYRGPDGGPQCQAHLYDRDGTEVEYVDAQVISGGLVFQDANGDALDCPAYDAGPYSSPMYQCQAGCIPVVDGGLMFCDPAFTCGDGGCGYQSTMNSCSPQSSVGDAGWSCSSLTVYPQGAGAPACFPNASGGLQCGPFTCVDNHLGGFDCGVRDCLPAPDGAIWCNSASCQLPSGGPTYACGYDGNHTPECTQCSANNLPTQSAVEVYSPNLGGGFSQVGYLPGAMQALPASLGGGTLLLGDGYQLQGSIQGGQTHFDGLPARFIFPDAGPGATPSEVRIAHDADGTPIALFQASQIQSQSTAQSTTRSYAVNWVQADGHSYGLSASVFSDNDGWRGSPIVMVLPLATGAAESAITWDLSNQQLLLIDPPSPTLGACAGAERVVPLSDLGLGPTDAVSGAVALPSAHGFALKIAGATPIENRWVLVGRADSGCGLTARPWSSAGLERLDLDTQVQGLASGDFNGDGVADLAMVDTTDITLFPGQLGGVFAQGDQYAIDSPMVSLSATPRDDGGALIGGLELLDARPTFFYATHNGSPEVPFSSSLAYAGSWVDPAPFTGMLLRGTELWGISVAGDGTATAYRYPDPFDPHSVTETPLSLSGLAQVEFFHPLMPDLSRVDAAWAVFGEPTGGGGRNLLLVHLAGQPDGTVQMDTQFTVSLTNGGLVSTAPEPDGGLEYLVTDNGHYAWGSAGVAPTAVSPAGFVPTCRTDQVGAIVQETGALLMLGIPGVLPDGGASCVDNDPNLTLFVYDPASGQLFKADTPLPNEKPIRAALASWPDGGGEILVSGFGTPGLLALRAAASGYTVDPGYQNQLGVLDLASYPTPDAGARHVMSQLQPPLLEALTR